TASGKTLSWTLGSTSPRTTVWPRYTSSDACSSDLDYSATMDWKDGSTSPGVIVASSAGGFDVQAGHTYEEEGSYPIHVSIADLGGSTVAADDSVSAGDAALTASGETLTATVVATMPMTTATAHYAVAHS